MIDLNSVQTQNPISLRHLAPTSDQMTTAQRYIPPLLTAFVGVATGVYVFDPILKQYKEDTHGTFKPEDVDELKVTERTKQEAKEQEERIKAFKKHVEEASGKKSTSDGSEVKKDLESIKDKVGEVGIQVEEKAERLVDQSKAFIKGEKEWQKNESSSWWPFSSKH